MVIEYINANRRVGFSTCLYNNDSTDIWRVLSYGRASASSYWQMRYCTIIKDREEMWKGMLNTNISWRLESYCLFVKERPEIREAILNTMKWRKSHDY